MFNTSVPIPTTNRAPRDQTAFAYFIQDCCININSELPIMLIKKRGGVEFLTVSGWPSFYLQRLNKMTHH